MKGSISEVFTYRLTTAVRLSTSKARIKVGKSLVLTYTPSPARAGMRLILEGRGGSAPLRWEVYENVASRPGGVTRSTFHAVAPGTTRLRVRLIAPGLVSSVSRVITVTVVR